MFVVPSGVSIPRRVTAAAAPPGALLTTTDSRTGAQRLCARASARGRGVGTLKAGSIGVGMSVASDGFDEPVGVPFAVVTRSAVAPHATTDATASAPAAMRTPGLSP